MQTACCHNLIFAYFYRILLHITLHPYDLSSQLPSHPIAANSFIGSPLPEDKPDNVFCLITAIQMASTLAPEEAISSTIARKSIDFKQILHASTNTISIHTIMQLLTSCRKPINAPLIIPNFSTASSPIPATSTFKPGDSMILTQGSCIGKLMLCGHVEMGQWSYHLYSQKTFRRLTIAPFYQPCNQRVTDC